MSAGSIVPLCMKGSRNFYAQISMLKELYYFYNNFSEASAAEGCGFNPTRVHSWPSNISSVQNEQ